MSFCHFVIDIVVMSYCHILFVRHASTPSHPIAYRSSLSLFPIHWTLSKGMASNGHHAEFKHAQWCNVQLCTPHVFLFSFFSLAVCLSLSRALVLLVHTLHNAFLVSSQQKQNKYPNKQTSPHATISLMASTKLGHMAPVQTRSPASLTMLMLLSFG